MYRNLRVLLLLVFVAIATGLKSQILPKEGSKLNYRIIGFAFPASQKTDKYKLEIAYGNYNNEQTFENNTSKTTIADTNRVVIELPFFGNEYTWRVVYTANASAGRKSGLHHFSTSPAQNLDTTRSRLRIVKNALKHKDAFVFMNGARALYDMKGKPVWYLPRADTSDKDSVGVRDLKLTPKGSVTFVVAENVYEANYNGDIIWKGPGNSAVVNINDPAAAHYHHQVTRMTNGHYMALGTEYLSWMADGENDHVTVVPVDPSNENHRMEFGTLIEYDQNGAELWRWRSADYYSRLPAYCQTILKGGGDPAAHSNAFFFDEKNNYAYVSFKNVSQVLKVKYPEGNVINSYGQLYRPALSDPARSLFCDQHSCNISAEGNLYLFNNNGCHLDEGPQVLMMRQPRSVNDSLKKIWEYEYPIEPAFTKLPKKQRALLFKKPIKTNGGNVVELADHSIFTSVCAPYSNLFIVDRSKKLLWDAIAEKWDESQKKWITFPQYRANIIRNRKELEHFIWNQEIENQAIE